MSDPIVIVIGVFLDPNHVNAIKQITEYTYELLLTYPHFKVDNIMYSGPLRTIINTSKIEILLDNDESMEYYADIDQLRDLLLLRSSYLEAVIYKIRQNKVKLTDIVVKYYGDNTEVYYPGRADMYPELK